MARLAAVLFALALCVPAIAQTWPTRPVRLVVGYPPGGSADFATRLLADELGKALGVAAVVDNRPGAGATIASEVVAKSAPDGYSILVAGNQAISKAVYGRLAYDPDKDLVPVARFATGATVLVVSSTFPAKDVKELIAYAKANPGKLFSASSGNGSAPHLASVLFEATAGVAFTTVQFKGGGPAAQSLLAGETQVMFATAPTVMGFIKTGRMRPLLVSKAERSPAIPGVPGGAEVGLPEFESLYWYGLFVPAGTPPAVIARLNDAVGQVLAKPEVREKLASQGMDATPSTSPEAFGAEIKAEAPQLERSIRLSGAKVE